MKGKKYCLGIDGGGTKTEFVLTDENGVVLSRLLDVGTNPNDIGLEACLDRLKTGINKIVKGYSPSDIYIFAGISGAGVGENAKILTEGLLTDYPSVLVDSDLVNALTVGLQGQDGLAVICGTGISCSICKGATRKTVGGYGYLFEDGGSGYAYGRDAVKAVLCAADGFGEKTVLTDYFKETYPNGVKRELGTLLLGGKSLIASFCPLVFQGYEAGDTVCEKIIENNLAHTVALVKNALKISESAQKTIAFVGGVTKDNVFRLRMQREFQDYTLIFSENKPIYGAVVKATTLAKIKIDETFEENFQKTIKGK